MPVNLQASENGKSMTLTLSDPWTINELLDTYPKAEVLFDAAKGPVHTIVDISKIGSIPSGALRARKSPFMSHPNSHTQVIVGAQHFARKMAEMVFQLTNFKRVKFFETIQEANDFVASLEFVSGD
jgi:hypothetical protein